MFYDTGIATYIWVLSNKKAAERKGQVQLINGVHLCGKMRKSLGFKRNEMSADDIATITRAFGAFEEVDAQPLDKPDEAKSNRGRQSTNQKVAPEKTFSSKLFKNHEFGYRRITIERPLRESYQFSDERIDTLRFAPKPFNAPMQWIYENYASDWSDSEDCPNYGVLKVHEVEIRAAMKADFAELKEKQIKDLLAPKTWHSQKQILLKARQLQAALGAGQHDDMNGYEEALKSTGIKLDASEKKQITADVTWKNPEAKKVIKKIHKGAKANPYYGLFAENKKIIEYKADGDLRDFENVPLDPTQTVNALNEAYFQKEVLPHVPDAWIDATKVDPIDGEIGIVGYEIPFNRHFYQYQPPRDLEEIDRDLDAVSAEILKLLQEVHS
jgi:type I restriction enzyme M protein